MDEATSALDAQTEQALNEAIGTSPRVKMATVRWIDTMTTTFADTLKPWSRKYVWWETPDVGHRTHCASLRSS